MKIPSLKLARSIVLFFAGVLMCTTAQAADSSTQYFQQGQKLIGKDLAGPAEQGTSVALSADGNTALVGGLADNNQTGAAWGFTRSGGVWDQEGDELVGDPVLGASRHQR